MAKSAYTASLMLANIGLLLEAMTPDEFIPPDIDAPRKGRRIGTLTDNQKALVMLIDRSLAAHHALHMETGLPFGGNPNLSMEHRLLHAMNVVLPDLLDEDLANAFPELRNRRFTVDRNWDVYVLPKWGLFG